MNNCASDLSKKRKAADTYGEIGDAGTEEEDSCQHGGQEEEEWNAHAGRNKRHEKHRNMQGRDTITRHN